MHTIKIEAGVTIDAAAHLLVMEARSKNEAVSALFNDITLTAYPELSVIDIILQFDRAMFERRAKEFVEKQRVEALAMHWQKAEEVSIDELSWYIVKTNGAEWRDNDLFVWRGWQLKHNIRPEMVRGRPIWIAKITDPEEK